MVPKHQLSDFGHHENSEVDFWDLMQREQVDFCIDLEWPFFYGSPAWHKSNTVLDIGCGFGYYLAKIAERFPGKQYAGYDISEEFIDIARRRFETENVKFDVGDAHAVKGQFDFILARLVFQHLPDPEHVLKSIADSVTPGGHLLIVDARDAWRYYYPELPRFMEFFRAFVDSQKIQSLNRDFVHRLPENAEKYSEWHLANAWEVVIPSTTPGNLKRFQTIYGELFHFIEETETVDVDYEALRAEWADWCSRPDAYTHAGLSIVLLQKK
jgi:SAM-dependent methyltransferase